MSYDEAISTLLTNSSIEVGDCDTSAIVKFTIAYQYYFEQLNVCLLTNFTYVTSIPCYKNTTPFSGDCVCPYSNDTKVVDRSDLDLNDDMMSVFSGFESNHGNEHHNHNNHFHNYTNLDDNTLVSGNSHNSDYESKHDKTKHLDEYTMVSDNNTHLISEISKIIAGAESIASDGSDGWC